MIVISTLREVVSLTRGLKNLRVLVISGAVGTLAAGLLNPILPVFLASRGLDLGRIGLVFTLGSLLPIFLQPMLGALSDRFSRKGFVVGLSIATSLLIPAFALLHNPLALAAALAAKVLLSRSAAPVSGALVADFAPTQKRATVFAVLESTANLTFVAALVASSAVVKGLGITGVFFVGGGLFLTSSLLLLALDERRAAPTGAQAAPRSSWRIALDGLTAPFRYAKQQPTLGRLFAYQFCFTFALDLYPVYLPLFAVKLGAPQSLTGPLIAASWLVYALVQPTGGRLSDQKAQRKGLIVFGLSGMVLFSFLLGLSGWLPAPWALPAMIAAWVLLAVPDGLFRSSAQALVVDLAPPDERGKLLGGLGGAAALANVLAPLAYGLVANRAGLGAAFFVSSAALALALAVLGRVREPAPVTPVTPLVAPPEPG